MLTQLTVAADASSGLGALGLNLSAFVIQLLTFLIIFLVLKRWAFEPITKRLDERRKLIESGVTLGETMRAEHAKLAEEVAQVLHGARQQADEVLASAHTSAHQIIEDAEAAAVVRTEAIVQTAHRQIQITAARERNQLKTELVHLVADVSGTVIGKKLNSKDDAAMIDTALHDREAA